MRLLNLRFRLSSWLASRCRFSKHLLIYAHTELKMYARSCFCCWEWGLLSLVIAFVRWCCVKLPAVVLLSDVGCSVLGEINCIR